MKCDSVEVGKKAARSEFSGIKVGKDETDLNEAPLETRAGGWALFAVFACVGWGISTSGVREVSSIYIDIVM